MPNIETLKKLEDRLDNYCMPKFLEGTKHNLKRLVEVPSYFLSSSILKVFFNEYFNTTISNKENLPKKGGAMIISHHSIPMIGCFLGSQINRQIHFLIQREKVYDNFLMGAFLWAIGEIPISSEEQKIESLKHAIKRTHDYLNRGHICGLFPEGPKKYLPKEQVLTPLDERDYTERTGNFVIKKNRQIAPVIFVGSWFPKQVLSDLVEIGGINSSPSDLLDYLGAYKSKYGKIPCRLEIGNPLFINYNDEKTNVKQKKQELSKLIQTEAKRIDNVFKHY